MKKVIFVCTGNTCRSPMAEAIAKKLWEGKAQVISRGLGPGGAHISANAAQVLKEHGFEGDDHISAGLTANEVAEADLVLTMTGQHRSIITDALPQFGYKVHTLCEYAGKDGDIPDPYMLGKEEYEACFEKIYGCINAIDIQE